MLSRIQWHLKLRKTTRTRPFILRTNAWVEMKTLAKFGLDCSLLSLATSSCGVVAGFLRCSCRIIGDFFVSNKIRLF